MKQTKKTLFVLISVGLITAMTSCAASKKTGCPTWGKVKTEQSNKKSV